MPSEPRPDDRRRQSTFALGSLVQLGEARRPWQVILPAVEGYGDDGPVLGYAGMVPAADLARANRIAAAVKTLLNERPPADALDAYAWRRDRARRLAAAVLPVRYYLDADEIGRLLSPGDDEVEADILDDVAAVLGSDVLSEVFRPIIRVETAPCNR